MRSLQFAAWGCACLALAGCRTDPNIAILERQNRMLEDKVYELREVIEDYQTALDQAACPTAPLPAAASRSEAPEAMPTPAPQPAVPHLAPPAPPRGITQPPTVKHGGVETSAEEALKGLGRPSSPRLIPPGQDNVTPKDGTKKDSPGRDTDAPPFSWRNRPATPGVELASGQSGRGVRVTAQARSSTDASKSQAPRDLPGPAASMDSRQVARIALSPRLTGGYGSGGGRGDEGIRVVLEPRDADGRLVASAAPVSIVVIDPALNDTSARVARWDFPADATSVMFRRSDRDGGMELELPWPGNAPRHRDLRLFARYTTSDGRKLQAEQPIRIKLDGDEDAQWTQTEPEPESSASTPSEPQRLPATPVVRVPTATSVPSPAGARAAAPPVASRPVWTPNRR